MAGVWEFSHIARLRDCGCMCELMKVDCPFTSARLCGTYGRLDCPIQRAPIRIRRGPPYSWTDLLQPFFWMKILG